MVFQRQKLIWLILLIPLIAIIVLGFTYNAIYAVPSNMQKTRLGGWFPQILNALGLPNEWIWLPALIYLFIVPFVMIFTIVYGFLRELRIFTRARTINIILALGIAISTLPVGAFVKMVSVIFATMGMWAVLAFAVMFFVGVFLMTLRRLSGWGVRTTISDEFSKRRTYESMLANARRLAQGYQTSGNMNDYNRVMTLIQHAMERESKGNIDGAIHQLDMI